MNTDLHAQKNQRTIGTHLLSNNSTAFKTYLPLLTCLLPNIRHIFTLKTEQHSIKDCCYSASVLWNCDSVASRPLLLRMWRGDLEAGKNIWGGEKGNKSHLAWGDQTRWAVSGPSWCRCGGHRVSDSRWPRATAVAHLQMAICPSVERHFDCWCSELGLTHGAGGRNKLPAGTAFFGFGL